MSIYSQYICSLLLQHHFSSESRFKKQSLFGFNFLKWVSSLFYLSYHSVFVSIRSLTLVFGYNECESDSTIGCIKGSSCITVNKCPQYTEGYENGSVWRYTCILGKWESITCAQLIPKNFKYPSSEYSFVLNQPITTIIPTIECYPMHI